MFVFIKIELYYNFIKKVCIVFFLRKKRTLNVKSYKLEKLEKIHISLTFLNITKNILSFLTASH